MTYNFRIVHSVTAFAVILSMLALLVPAISHAQPVGAGAFCTNLDTMQENILQRLSARTENARSRHNEQQSNYEEKKTERLGLLGENRGNADASREERYEKLRAQGTDDAQAAAIETFVSTVESLVATRRGAVDEAIDAFEDAVEAMRTGRSSEVDSFVDGIEAATAAAFEEAQSLCDDGASGSEVRDSLRNALEATRGEYTERREGYNYGEQLEEAREARREAVNLALETFRTDFAEARETLRTALGM